VENNEKCKNNVEEKGHEVNLDKLKIMKCEARFGPCKNVGKWPCGVCRCTHACRMWLVSDVRGVLMGSCFENMWP